MMAQETGEFELLKTTAGLEDDDDGPPLIFCPHAPAADGYYHCPFPDCELFSVSR